MSIYFDLMSNNERVAIVSIRELGAPFKGHQAFGYEISHLHKTVRGTVHQVPDKDDLFTVVTVLSDYLSKGGSRDPVTLEPGR